MAYTEHLFLNILKLQYVPPATVGHATNIWHADYLSADPELHPEKFSRDVHLCHTTCISLTKCHIYPNTRDNVH